MSLLLTFLSGLFFLVGLIIYRFVPNKIGLTRVSVACALVVILGLIFLDLIPELIEIGKWYFIIFAIIGLLILILIDKFIPNHEHDHHEDDEEKHEHINHMTHISTITIIALLIHNYIEGIALFGVASNDFKNGVVMLLGIGLHNLPFGFQIAPSIKGKNIGLVILLILSGFFGGVTFYLFGSLNEVVEGIIISLTLGMLIHILVFELLKEVLTNIRKKETICGIIIGIIILIVIWRF